MHDELINDLREDAEWAEANEWETPIMLSDHLKQAADAIEKMSEAYEKLSRHMDDLAALMPRWIPVRERLPKEIGNYLVVINCPR